MKFPTSYPARLTLIYAQFYNYSVQCAASSQVITRKGWKANSLARSLASRHPRHETGLQVEALGSVE